ncbi:MAG: capsid protein [Niallia sp.]
MATVNYATQYQQALQQKFSNELMFSALYNTPNNRTVQWVGAKTVKLPKITVGGFVDVDRDVVGSFTRRADNAWETKTLDHDREYRTLVDPQDIDETNAALSIANITNVFNTEQKIPEQDKYAASKLYTEFVAAGGTAVTTALTEANVLSIFDGLMEDMDEAEVPQEGRILYTTPAVKKLLKNAEAIQRTLEVRNPGQAVNRSVRSLDEVTIVTVPSSRMKTAYDFTDGAVADAAALQINMILVHPNAVITPQKYEFVSLDQPSATSGGKYLYYERLYWDLFVVESKVGGVQFHTDAPVAG